MRQPADQHSTLSRKQRRKCRIAFRMPVVPAIRILPERPHCSSIPAADKLCRTNGLRFACTLPHDRRDRRNPHVAQVATCRLLRGFLAFRSWLLSDARGSIRKHDPQRFAGSIGVGTKPDGRTDARAPHNPRCRCACVCLKLPLCGRVVRCTCLCGELSGVQLVPPGASPSRRWLCDVKGTQWWLVEESGRSLNSCATRP